MNCLMDGNDMVQYFCLTLARPLGYHSAQNPQFSSALLIYTHQLSSLVPALSYSGFLPFPLSRTRKHAILEINDLRLLQHRSCNLFELLVHRILVDVVISVLVGVESKYESVGYTILDKFSKFEF